MVRVQASVLPQDISRPRDEVLDTLPVRLTLGPQFKVLGPVVSPVTVPVMNVLRGKQGPSEHFAHDLAMQKNLRATRAVSHLHVSSRRVDGMRDTLRVALNEPREIASVLMASYRRQLCNGRLRSASTLTGSGWRNPSSRRLHCPVDASHLMTSDKAKTSVFRPVSPRHRLPTSALTERQSTLVPHDKGLAFVNECSTAAVTQMLRDAKDFGSFIHS